jgi:uroporphyrinogen-III synthase
VTRRVVLNTRAAAQASELSRLLTQAGFEPVEAPAITIAHGWGDTTTLDDIRRDLRAGLFDWVVLPSQNAGRDIAAELAGARIVCGAATAAALGITPEVVLDRFSAAAALETLRLRVLPGQRVLVPRAAEGRDELVDGLRVLGVEVTAPVAYRTEPVDAAAKRLHAGGIDVVTVCSPSAVRSVASAINPSVAVVCLGETTAEAARQVGLRVDAVAARTTMDALVHAVRQAVSEVRV